VISRTLIKRATGTITVFASTRVRDSASTRGVRCAGSVLEGEADIAIAGTTCVPRGQVVLLRPTVRML